MSKATRFSTVAENDFRKEVVLGLVEFGELREELRLSQLDEELADAEALEAQRQLQAFYMSEEQFSDTWGYDKYRGWYLLQ